MARYINAFEFKQKLLEERDKIPLTITQRYSFGVPEINRYGANVRCGIRTALRCMEQTPTAEVVDYEKYRDVVYKLECLLCYATGNRFSKSEYSLQDMKRMVDDYVQQLIDEATEHTVSREEFDRVCRERDAAISALESQRWIPVTERLPEELDQTDSRWSRYSRPSEDVLTVVSGRCNVLWFSYSDKLWCSVEEDITYWKDEVTHWMHLPKPPKEVEDDK